MQKLSNSKIISIVTKLLALLLIAKSISLVLWWYLPSEGVELNAKKSYQASYQRVDFKNMLIRSNTRSTTATVKTETSYSMDNLVLKGLYGSKYDGFAIVAKKSSPAKTTIVAVSEVYAGYKLKEIHLTKVMFTKGSKDYVLMLEKSKIKFSKVVQKVYNNEPRLRSVGKQDIKYYSKNPSKIWKDIAISEVMINGKIDGFRVNRIKANSKMAALGLQKGDIILKANNIELKSYNDALKLYKDIDKIETVELVIRRNNQERELIYEIH